VILFKLISLFINYHELPILFYYSALHEFQNSSAFLSRIFSLKQSHRWFLLEMCWFQIIKPNTCSFLGCGFESKWTFNLQMELFQIMNVSFILAKFFKTTILQSTFILMRYFVGVSFYYRSIWAYSQTLIYSLYMLFCFL
jgi:hypothetical protein